MANEFKNARSFLHFDVEGFQKNHVFQLLKVEPGYNYVNKEREEKPSHTKVLVMIISDYTDEGKTGAGVNQYTQLSVKFPAISYNDHNVAQLMSLAGKRVALVDPEIKVYGDFQNQLSVTAKSIEPLKAGAHESAKANQQ